MSTIEIARAWKYCFFRDSLTESQRALLPAHPAGAPPFESDPANCAGGMALTGTVSWLTSVFSCTYACSETMWDGSCDFFTYGCC